MARIAVKRVYDPPAASDGRRVLIDRLWPRGLTKATVKLDDWCKDLAPTPELRRWFDHRADRFAEFSQRYRAELARNPAVEAARGSLGKGRVTLLYGAKDPRINHAVVLAEYLRDLTSRTRRMPGPRRDSAR